VTDVEVFSSGTYAKDGAPASSLGVQECAKHDVDTSGHQAQLLHRELIRNSDLILCMEAAHVFEVLRMVPDAETRVNLLGGYNAEPHEAVDMAIFDPIGGDEADYRRCYTIIEDHLERAYPAIRDEIDAARMRGGRASNQGEGTDG
jgi:protein-tyrosine-phosphatase